MVAFSDPNRLIGFNRDVFSGYSYYYGVLVKFLACEVYSSISDNYIG